jgi:hypothetical protein
MSLVQLSKLNSQLNALAAHFNDPVIFKKTLISLFLLYEKKVLSSVSWSRNSSQLQSYNVPESVMTELESRIAGLSRIYPEQTLVNADILWDIPYYESRKIAIVMITSIGDEFQNEFLKRIQLWLSASEDEILKKDLLTAVEEKPAIMQNKQWLDLIKTWLNSSDVTKIKLGLLALNKTLGRDFQNLPEIFSLLTPLVSRPNLAIQKELTGILQTLISISPAETASFLMMVSELYSNDDVFLFLRKCLPLFDNFFQEEIRRSFSSNK